jgi:hypothetical protein
MQSLGGGCAHWRTCRGRTRKAAHLHLVEERMRQEQGGEEAGEEKEAGGSPGVSQQPLWWTPLAPSATSPSQTNVKSETVLSLPLVATPFISLASLPGWIQGRAAALFVERRTLSGLDLTHHRHRLGPLRQQGRHHHRGSNVPHRGAVVAVGAAVAVVVVAITPPVAEAVVTMVTVTMITKPATAQTVR